MIDPRETSETGAIDDRASTRRLGKLALIAVAAIVAIAAASWLLTPREVPLPAGATALRLQTQRPPLIPISLGCPLALLVPITVAREGTAMVFLSEASQERVQVAWPSGWSARLLGGRAELVRPDGNVFAREGDVIANRLVGGTADDGTFLICSTDSFPTNPNIPSPKPPDPI